MTSDPKRWLSDDGHADAAERALLESVRDVRPSAGAKEQAWQALAAAIGTATAASVAPAAAAASSGQAAAALSAGKMLMLAVAAGSVAIGGYVAVQRAWPSSAPVAPRAPSVQQQAPAPRAPQPIEPGPAPAALEPQAPAARVQAAQAPKRGETNRLEAESALVTRARAALRAGDPHEAQRLLQRLASEVPRGVLAQEREVLAIEVLAALGQQAAAVKRAQAFTRAHPGSPHSERLDALSDPP